jgi:hypothetical protein
MSKQQILTLILLVSPILLIQLALAIYALIDLSRRSIVRGQRWVWAAVLIVTAFGLPTGILASGLYLSWGRHTDVEDDQD